MSLAERMWYGTVYMLTITNRVNYTTHTPPSGLWHNFYTSDNQGWPGYTTDINTQSPYFGAAAANHAETELAMIDLHDQFIPLGRRISALAYNCERRPDLSSCNRPGLTTCVRAAGTDPGVLLPVEIDACRTAMLSRFATPAVSLTRKLSLSQTARRKSGTTKASSRTRS